LGRWGIVVGDIFHIYLKRGSKAIETVK
jgi:hypothetical protein